MAEKTAIAVTSATRIRAADGATLLSMLLITCPVTRTDELVADRRIRSVANHPTHIAMHVECPACGAVHRPAGGRHRRPQARSSSGLESNT